MAVSQHETKEALFDAFASVAKALASGRRAEIVDVLAQGERSVEELSTEISQSLANTSHHLQALARGGLVASRRDGTRIIYRLASESVETLWEALREVAAERVAGIDGLAADYLGRRDQLQAITRKELADRLRRGEVIVIDVRPNVEYNAGHITGAESVPLPELRRHLAALPKDVEIVAYCRGPYCVYADDAVRALRRRGFRASRLEDGFPEWRRAGHPVEAGTTSGVS
jgi:rhodanese-related sulfurtransferase